MKNVLLKTIVATLFILGAQGCGTDSVQTTETSELQAARAAWGCTFDRWESEYRRVGCLARAVRGIGNSTAKKLISNNEFRYPPSSWSAFKNYMKILQRRYDLNDLYYNTVVRYGSSNKQNLY